MNASPPEPTARLGTFLGVFTPTVLTILGVIMYLRAGWVVGQVGVGGALLIVVVAHAITLATTLSMSALATSMRVGVGGAYYLISRSVGLGVGGAIGIPLYLSQALSVTLYAYGLAEVAALVLPEAPTPWVAAAIIAVVGIVAGRSTQLALRLQLPIMVLIFASIGSLLAGVDLGGSLQVSMGPPPGSDAGIWVAFAVFFPAVTGILAGVSLSGDLEDPGRAIPNGTLAAVGVGFGVYLGVPVALGMLADAPTLRDDSRIWTAVAAVPWLVVPGMVGAILSSALGSVLGAPRTLQALAKDGLAPEAFATTNDRGEPTTAMGLTVVIALAATSLGSLDLVATVLTMFFLTTYGMLNLVAGTEALVRDPSYRPRIPVPWWVSYLGGIGCVAAMLLVNPIAAAAAVLIEVAVFLSLRRRAMRATWGDVRSGIWYSLARWSLQQLFHARKDPRNWRPHILLFAADLERSLRLVRFAADFGQERGLVTIATLVVGDVDEAGRAHELAHRHRAMLDERGIVAFPEVDVVPDLTSGVLTVAQANGYAGLSSNTAMFGWPHDQAGLATLLGLTRRLTRIDISSMIVRLVDSGHPARTGTRPTAVLWWKGKQHNGDLMLLLAHLLSQSGHWHGLQIVLRTIVDDAEAAAERQAALDAWVPDLRLPVKAEVLVSDGDPRGMIVSRSQDASVVFLGLRDVPPGEEADHAAALHDLVTQLPSTVLVRNAGPFRGQLV